MNCYRLERFQIRLFIYYSMKSPCTYWFSPYVINQFILLQFIDLINASINVSVGSPNLYGCSEALHNLASYETVITECTYSRQTITLLQTDVRVNNSSTTHSPRPFSWFFQFSVNQSHLLPHSDIPEQWRLISQKVHIFGDIIGFYNR